MSRQGAPRQLSLTEELEKLEQSITLTLQEIDESFSKAHRIVTTSILPIVEQYSKHSDEVWEGSKFWKQFFEASANVSLSGYEEAALEDEVTQTDTTTTDADVSTTQEESSVDESQLRPADDDSFSIDSPTQMTGSQSTPRPQAARPPQPGGKTSVTVTTAAFRSPSPKKQATKSAPEPLSSSYEPSTPRQRNIDFQSSPFQPESAVQPSAFRTRNANDPIMHRAVLDKNYRVQATPHTQRRRASPGRKIEQTPASASTRAAWEDSPGSSPLAAAPQLRSELFSPVKGAGGAGARSPDAARHKITPARITSTGRRLYSPQDKPPTFGSARKPGGYAYDDEIDFDDDFYDDNEDDTLDMSPPKTLQFHVPQSRLLQTPAREASRRIVEDLLLTAGADATDEIEGEEDLELDVSPSVVRGAYDVEDDTF